MIIVEDSRQKLGKHNNKHKYFEKNEIICKRAKLPVGDYAKYDELPNELKEKIDFVTPIYECGCKPKPKIIKQISDELSKYIRLSIDTKQNLNEVYGNLCQDNERFKAELLRAREAGIKLIILCEHGGKIKTFEDVKNWHNPRLDKNPYAWNGERLYKTMRTVAEKYNTDFLFCNKEDTGKKIIDLLL